MAIHSRTEFADLEALLQQELEKTLQERRELVLSVPENWTCRIEYYNAQKCAAQACYSPRGSYIGINLLTVAYPHLDKADQEKVQQVATYFDIVREFLGNVHESAILELLEDPLNLLGQWEASVPSDWLQHKKDIHEQLGVSYDQLKAYAIMKFADTRDALDELLPKIIEAFPRIDFSSLRHEMDHVDFFDAQVYHRYARVCGEAGNIEYRFRVGNEQSLATAHMNAQSRLLQARSQMGPLIETRAHFFNYISLGSWQDVEWDGVKEKVYSCIDQNYVEGAYAEEILGRVMSAYWNRGEMDRATSNYLFWRINMERNSTNASRYTVDTTQVNFDVAEKVLVEVQRWQDVFRENLRRSVDACAKAYQEDPSRFATAKNATTFDEYVSICSGNSVP